MPKNSMLECAANRPTFWGWPLKSVMDSGTKNQEEANMKFWTRLMVASLALAVALSFAVSPAQAASKKKKKKAEIKKELHREMVKERPHPIEGLNTSGKPGYFIADTAAVLDKGQIAGAAHLTFDTNGNVLQIPIGVSYGITDKIMVNVNSSFFTAGGASGIYFLNFGGKYGFGYVAKGLEIAAGIDFGIGPLSSSIYGGVSNFAFDPYGVATYTFPDGLQFNGKLGLYVSTYSATYPVYQTTTTPPYYTYVNQTVSASYSDFQLDLGAAYPFDHELSGFAELATNGVIGAAGVGGTPILVGIRTGHDVQLQGFAGMDLGGQVGLFVGGGVALFSK
jgi:hypothetical protein